MEKSKGNTHVSADNLKIRAQKLREERNAKQEARLMMLRNLHLQKACKESIYLSSNIEAKKHDKQKQSTIPSIKKNIISHLNVIPNDSCNNNKKNIDLTNNVIESVSKKNTEPSIKSAPINSNKLTLILSNKNIKSRNVEPMRSIKNNLINKTDFRKSNLNFENIKSRYSIMPTKSQPFQNNININIKKRETICMLPPKQNINTNKLCKPPTVIKRSTIVPKSKSAVLSKIKENKILNKKSSVSENEFNTKRKMRRSLSTVHFQRLGSKAVNECFKRTISVGNVYRKEIEEELMKPTEYVMPVESERKKSVKFFTPLKKYSTPNLLLNTPKPSELRKRLNDWLQKRGKSLSTYHHLKCFGLKNHNQSTNNQSSYNEHNLRNSYEDVNDASDENKENVEIPDDDSFKETMTGQIVDNAKNWHQTDLSSDTFTVQTSFIENDKHKSFNNCTPKIQFETSINPLIVDALHDLNQLISEDYSWLQCAKWLQAITYSCTDEIKNIPIYWECRAALEERRGDFVRTLDCFKNALQHGAQSSTIENSLDNLLDKFMKLNLESDLHKDENLEMSNQKRVNIRNIVKSSLIKFAIKEQTIHDKLNDTFQKKYVATPVRRSSRNENSTFNLNTTPNLNFMRCHEQTKISNAPNSALKKPLSEKRHSIQIYNSLKNVNEDIKQTLTFVPNKALNFNDRV